MFCCASDKTGVVASKDKRIVFRLPPAAGHGDSPCGSRGGRPGPSWTASAPTSRTGVFFSTAAKLPRPGRQTATPLNLELADFQYEGTVNLLQRTGHRRPHGARRTSGALRKILEGRSLLREAPSVRHPAVNAMAWVWRPTPPGWRDGIERDPGINRLCQTSLSGKY